MSAQSDCATASSCTSSAGANALNQIEWRSKQGRTRRSAQVREWPLGADTAIHWSRAHRQLATRAAIRWTKISTAFFKAGQQAPSVSCVASWMASNTPRMIFEARPYKFAALSQHLAPGVLRKLASAKQ
jgi:hypothetical protein